MWNEKKAGWRRDRHGDNDAGLLSFADYKCLITAHYPANGKTGRCELEIDGSNPLSLIYLLME